MIRTDKKFSPVLHNWKWNVKSNRKMIIILTVLHMAAAPAIFLSAIFDLLSEAYVDVYIYVGIGAVTTCVAGFMGIIIAVNSFNCLHKKSVVDMKLSLPMTSSQRFVSDFLSGLFVYLAPFLAAQAVALILAGIGNLVVYNDVSLPYSYSHDYFANDTVILLKLILCGLLVMLMLYTLTVLITVCCGSKFESVACSIGVNVVIPVTILMVTNYMFDGIFGIDPENNAMRTFLLTSPAGGIGTIVLWALEGDLINDYMHPAVWAVLFLLITAAFGVFAFFLYIKRRAEQVSKPFVFKLVYYIIVTGIMFCICSIAHMADGFIPGIIISAVAFFIFEIVANRGFRRIWLTGIKYAVTVSAAFLIVFIAQVTGGFGSLWHVPANIAVSSVEIDYYGELNDFRLRTAHIILRERENVEKIIGVHKTILDEYRDYIRSGQSRSSYYEKVLYSSTITIKYRLVSGGTIEREYYNVFTPAVYEAISGIEFTDEYKERLAENYKKELYRWRDEYKEKKSEIDQMRIDRYAVLIINTSLSNGLSRTREKVLMSQLYDDNFFDRFAEEYANEIKTINESNYSSPYGKQYILDTEFGRIYIPVSFEKTLHMLDEFGFDISRVDPPEIILD